MIIRNKVGKYKFNIIFRYQGDKVDKESTTDSKKWNEKKLGIWWKPYSVKSFKNKNEDIAKGVMFGINLIWANFWFDISKNKNK